MASNNQSPHFELTRSHKQFGGCSQFYTHFSEVCQHPMNFAVYLPPQAELKKLPVLYWLSGLTCSEEIFMTEGQAQAYAKKYEIILIVPDTSPKNTGIEGENETYDLGSGAGFYVDATENKWAKHYQMDTYVTQELRTLVESKFPIDSRFRGIFGHSMGGHGALTLGLRNPNLYDSISAFAPICHPVKTPWGKKAFSAYLGSDENKWKAYDACELVRETSVNTPILIDQGTDDEFLAAELSTNDLEVEVKKRNYPATIRRQAGYDHSYFFISTFMEDHLAFHAENFKRKLMIQA